mmetsp:Transcript_17388/g.35356  ORF Transcript_17388/g.35356 Transcript_17388/m.35356 type:complete len:285 (+) Transcript_17388:91-945(+)
MLLRTMLLVCVVQAEDRGEGSNRILQTSSTGLLKPAGERMATMRKGGDRLLTQALSPDEQEMLKAMADQFRVPVANNESLAVHGSHAQSSGGATAVGSISLMAPGGSVIASGLNGKVQLQTVPGTNDGGIRLLSSWCPDWTPVCAADGQTLPSACWARNLGLESQPGACGGATAYGGAGDGESRAGRAIGDSVSMVEASLPLTPAPPPALEPSVLPAGLVQQQQQAGLVSDFLNSEAVDPICGCPLTDAAPVCGSDGKTYDSYCWARCAQTEVLHLGPCVKSAS